MALQSAAAKLVNSRQQYPASCILAATCRNVAVSRFCFGMVTHFFSTAHGCCAHSILLVAAHHQLCWHYSLVHQSAAWNAALLFAADTAQPPAAQRPCLLVLRHWQLQLLQGILYACRSHESCCGCSSRASTSGCRWLAC